MIQRYWLTAAFIGLLTVTFAVACGVFGDGSDDNPVTVPTAIIPRNSDETDIASSPEIISTTPAGALATKTNIPEISTATVTLPDPTSTPTPASSEEVQRDPSPTATRIAKPSTTVETPAIPQEDPPLIRKFQANVEIADPGDTITLTWETSNAITVTLWHLAATGQFSEFWTVNPAGSFEYAVKEHEHNRTTFALSAVGEGGAHEMATIAVTLQCTDEWFFDFAPNICPADAPLFSAGAEQRFEHGIMIWIGEEDRIYVLFDDNLSYAWEPYQDEWDPGEPDRDPSLSPPSGLYQPVRGFGLVWREKFNARDRLGWAVAEEVSYDTAIQRTSYAKYNETYILAEDGGIWRLRPERSGWEKITTQADN